MTTERPVRGLRRRPALLIALVVAGAASFAWIATQVFTTGTDQLDEHVGTLVQRCPTPPLTAAMRAITVFGSVAMAPALVLAALAAVRRRAWRGFAIPLLLASSGAGLLDQLLKHLLPRARPAPLFGMPPSAQSSFPSGHALFAMSLYGTLAWLIARRVTSGAGRVCVWAGASLLILAVGFSRVYLGLHYATDVFAGYAAGIAWLSVVLLATGEGGLSGTRPCAASDRQVRPQTSR